VLAYSTSNSKHSIRANREALGMQGLKQNSMLIPSPPRTLVFQKKSNFKHCHR